MEVIFLKLYDYFRQRKAFLYTIFSITLVVLLFLASRIEISEDISRFFHNDKKLEKVNQIFTNSRFAEKLVVLISARDSTQTPDPDTLINFADSLTADASDQLKPYVKRITSQVDDELALKLFDVIYEYLPIFLNENDFAQLDSITQPASIKLALEDNYRQLISPSGFALKKIIVKDPVGISKLVLKKLKSLQYDQDFELINGHIFTRDHKYLLVFIEPAYSNSDTGKNTKLLDQFDDIIHHASLASPEINVEYFGAVAVAVGNARQLRADTILTVSVMLTLLIFFLFGFLRKKSAPLVILIPVLFGGLFSLAIIYLIQGTISALALATGSIVVGIAINYSLHFLSHLKHSGNIRTVVKDLAEPMTLGSATTVLAFLSLQFAKAPMLGDIGLFAGFSLIGAALCSLIFLPHLLSDTYFNASSVRWSLKVPRLPARYNGPLVAFILIGTPFMLYLAGDVSFNSDMMKLNFMSPSLTKTQETLNRISKYSTQSVYVVADGNNLEQALRANENLQPVLNGMLTRGVIKKYSSVASFIISDSLQHARVSRWNAFWTNDKKKAVGNTLKTEATKLKFSATINKGFDSLVGRHYITTNAATSDFLRNSFFGDYITEKNGLTTVVTLAAADPQKTPQVYKELKGAAHVEAVDKRMLTTLFVDYVHADFTFIVTSTSLLVFFVLLLYYGRLELTLITFLPMLFTWIWILGAMALLSIEFNIVNVMISTFIFGLGDDYSIFIMDGLIKEYKTGKESLITIQDSIFLSAVTTICGLGVLIFAQHPALKSIAAISIIGILTVVIMSQVLEPFLFRKLISDRTRKKLPPVTLKGFFWSTAIYALFVFGSFFLTVLGLLLKIAPLPGKAKRYFYHAVLSQFMRLIILLGPVRMRVINLDNQYAQPQIFISNHESFLDILVTTMNHPKVLLLTTDWVWNSPIFGWVVKLADYYPVKFGAEGSVEKLSKRVAEGYSIVIFPEGTRSLPGHITRFHKGAFYLAEKLKLDIVPLLLHGGGVAIPKGELYMRHTTMTQKFLPAIAPDDTKFGTTYSEKARNVARWFREEYQKVALEQETLRYFRRRLISNYIYKGPVLEWYVRIKLYMENYYADFAPFIPINASVLDLGCGYGILSYLLNFQSPDRKITGIDFDEEKIALAQNGFARGENLQFVHADITEFSFPPHDAIIVSDVLHYLSPSQQEKLLSQCFEKLLPGGVLILRDGDSDLKDEHGMTKLSELFSVKLLRFNKSKGAMNFVSGEQINSICNAAGMEVEKISRQKYTSNVIFVIRRKGT